ncbi:MAG: deoxyribose-phosphate aldolase [Caldilineaceae bacterium]|nr:deoxyribose-phosphate aldolase [Caldilineaceae bacterium]
MSTHTEPTQAELDQRIRTAIDAVPAASAHVNAIVEPATVEAAEMAGMIDHTILKPEAVEMQIRQLCEEADTYGFASVCVNATWTALCADLLAESDAKVCTVVGFPLGASTGAAKAFEAAGAVDAGAQEVDMVLNIGKLRDGDWVAVRGDIAAVAAAVHARGALLKVILETCLLSDDEKIAACVLSEDAGADFVKTSTGMNKGGATVADVMLMRAVVGDRLGVKASGGIRTAEDAARMVAAGATRIGASSGIAILRDMTAGEGADAPTDAGGY